MNNDLKKKYLLEAIRNLEAVEAELPQVQGIINQLARLSNKITVVNLTGAKQLEFNFKYDYSN